MLHEQLQSARTLLADTTDRMIKMEKRLSITDESMNQSSDIFQIRLKEMDSEIRKLWDNVWKRAKQQLAEQGKQIKALQAEFDKQNGVHAQMTGAHTEMNAVHAQLKQALSETRLAMEAVEDQVEGNAQMVEQLSGLDEQTGAQQDAIDELKRVLESLQEADNDMVERLAGIEEWVDSFNGYRTQMNRKLLDLQGAVDSLQGQ